MKSYIHIIYYLLFLLFMINCKPHNNSYRNDLIGVWNATKMQEVDNNSSILIRTMFEFYDNNELLAFSEINGLHLLKWELNNDSIILTGDKDTINLHIEKLNRDSLIITMDLDETKSMIYFKRFK